MSTLTWRELTAQDAELTFQWRTSPHVDHMMTGDAPGSFQEHLAWLSNILTSADCKYWIFKWDNREVGLVCLTDFSDDLKSCEFGIYIGEADLIGQGIGRLVMTRLIELADSQLGIRELRCKVLAINTRALNLYRDLGFEDQVLIDQDPTDRPEEVVVLARRVTGRYQ